MSIIKLQSCDGEIFEVEKEIVKNSKLIAGESYSYEYFWVSSGCV